MTRISKRMLTYILSAIAFLSLILGVMLSIPQTRTAKAADTAVTFSAAVLDKESHATYGTSIRFNTSGLQWNTNHNWETQETHPEIADYTTINGRTITEINAATTSTQKATVMMQGAGTFSFLRVYLPEAVMSVDDVRSMGILDGWSFIDERNNNIKYTASAATFYYSGSTTMTPADSYSSATKLTASDITISEASLTSPNNTVNSEGKEVIYGPDSLVVDINTGVQVYNSDANDVMQPALKSIRNSIYINGKSIEEWNAQLIAEDARFNKPSTYSMYPQNSTDSGHKNIFVKPIFLLELPPFFQR